MNLRTGLVVLIVGFGICAGAAAAPASKATTPSVAARLDALEKQNAALSEQVARLQKLLTQTRMDLAVAMGGPGMSAAASAYVGPPAILPLTGQGLSTDPQIQNQINQNTIQQQSVQTQLGNLQLQQSMDQDRMREQQMQNLAPH